MADSLEKAIKLIKPGDRADANRVLVTLLKEDPTNDQTWVWMTAVVDTGKLRMDCLQEALKHNPNNPTARRGLVRLQSAQPPEGSFKPQQPVSSYEPQPLPRPAVSTIPFRWKPVREGAGGWAALGRGGVGR